MCPRLAGQGPGVFAGDLGESDAAPPRTDRLVWYDEVPEAGEVQPGLYRYTYQMCSYGRPQVCGNRFGAEWHFIGVDTVPFSKD